MADNSAPNSEPSSTPTPVAQGTIVKKKPMFKKPDWLANRQSPANVKDEVKAERKNDAEAVDIFSRSNDTHAIILAERAEKERRSKEKKEGKLLKREKERDLIREESSSENIRETKRLRRSTSKEEQGGIGDRQSLSAEPNSTSPNSLSKRYSDAISAPAARLTQKSPVVIDLGDSDSDNGEPNKPISLERDMNHKLDRGRPLPEAPRPEDDPDEEFPELVAKAREQTKQRERQLEQQTSYRGQGSVLQNPSSAEEPDPIISIMINPLIPNTAPLLVKRKYRQNFKDVRLAWCAKNNIPDDARHKVFFTWRDRRVFDVASCRSIGIKLDFDGRTFMKKPEDGSTELVDQIVLNATTIEIEEEAKKAKELAAKEEERAARSPSPERKELQYRVVMRSKGHADQKILVRETTEMRKIADVFRRTNKISPDKHITVNYDGEDLSPDQLVKDTEIMDLEPGEAALLEMHIK